jgi:heme-degrading monooxygenase HmoA
VIVRTWSARATPSGAAEYNAYFADVLVPELRALAGFAGAYLLSRDNNGTVELTTHTFWDSTDAIRTFAGENMSRSVVEPQARAVLLDFDGVATHHEVLVDART